MAKIVNLAQAIRANNIAMRAENAGHRARLAILQEPQYAPRGPDHNKQHVAPLPVSNYHAYYIASYYIPLQPSQVG